MKKLPHQPVNGLIEGLAIIQKLTMSNKPVSTTQLAQELNMEKTRVNRILKRLDYLEIAYRTNSRKYTIGSGIHVLAAQSIHASGLIQSAVRNLEPLQQYGYVVALGFLALDQVCYLYHWVPGLSSIEAIGRLAMYPAERSSIGVVLLAERDEEYLSLVENRIASRNGSVKSLRSSVEQAKIKKYAEVKETKDALSLAVTLGNPVFGAIALSGNIPPEQEGFFIQLLNKTAMDIEKDLNPSSGK